MGWHRTGTAGDSAALDWLESWARSHGYMPQQDGLRFTCRSDLACSLRLEDEPAAPMLQGMSLFDSPCTGPEGLLGRLVLLGEDGEIGCTSLRPDAATTGGEPFVEIRRRTRHQALIVLTHAGDNDLAPLNAPFYSSPYGPPVLQLPAHAAPVLIPWSRERRTARIHVTATHDDAHTANLRVRLPGSQAALAPLLVVTPRTSWYQSTAERGGGLVGWLALLSSQRPGSIAPPRAMELVATCGHELGHMGIRHELARSAWQAPAGAPAPHAPHLALHLGANIGAREPALLHLRATHVAHAQSLQAALVAAGYPAQHLRIDAVESAVGEARDLLLRGWTVVSLVGENRWFHAPGDRWPDTVSLPHVTALARGLTGWVQQQREA